MKKTLRAFISFLLIAAMLMLPAFAAAKSDNNNDVKYVCFGDSIAGGIGLPDNPIRGPYQEDKTKVYCGKIAGSYPVLVAEALGVKDENFAQLACAGMRTVELRACLDPAYTVPDSYANNFTGGTELKEWVMDRFDYRKYVSEADIISINMCANDIGGYALLRLEELLSRAGVSDIDLDKAVGSLVSGGDYISAVVKLLDLSKTIGVLATVPQSIASSLYVGYNRWIENWDAIMRIIYELNPDVTVVAVGMNNPFNHLKISQDSLLEIGKAVDGIVQLVNYWSAVGSAYSDRYLYVDIMGIETMMEEHGTTIESVIASKNFELEIHPSVKGHQQIADRIVSALEKNDLMPCDLILSQFKIVTRGIVNKYGAQFNELIGSYLR